MGRGHWDQCWGRMGLGPRCFPEETGAPPRSGAVYSRARQAPGPLDRFLPAMPGSPPPDRPAACPLWRWAAAKGHSQVWAGAGGSACLLRGWRPGCSGFGRFAQMSTAQAGVLGRRGRQAASPPETLHPAEAVLLQRWNGRHGGQKCRRAGPGSTPLTSPCKDRPVYLWLSGTADLSPGPRGLSSGTTPAPPAGLHLPLQHARHQSGGRDRSVSACALLTLRSVAL